MTARLQTPAFAPAATAARPGALRLATDHGVRRREAPRRAVRTSVPHRFAAELKAMGRPFPRVLELGSGPGELADTVLHEVPGLRLVSLDFSDAMRAAASARLDAKVGRLTRVARGALEPDWADGLGRFDAIITTQRLHDLRPDRDAVALYAQVRQLLLPGGLFLLADHADDPLDGLEHAGWSSIERLRPDPDLMFLKARP